jgi:rubrerythrin
MEVACIKEVEPDYVKPEPPEVKVSATDVNVISGACGEIYETSDMYPSFIKVAIEEGEKRAEGVFTRAKLAESVHAQRYMDAYNNIDAPSNEPYYLCPVCGYIHLGDGIEKCPICWCPFDKFTRY